MKLFNKITGQVVTDLALSLIKGRRIAIFSRNIYPSPRPELEIIFQEICPGSDTRCLSTRDNFFTHCPERNAWYGHRFLPKYISPLDVIEIE